jgi:hypothetical protein
MVNRPGNVLADPQISLFGLERSGIRGKLKESPRLFINCCVQISYGVEKSAQYLF